MAGGELASTFVVSRIVTSAENDRPQGHKKRGPLLSLVIEEFEAKKNELFNQIRK